MPELPRGHPVGHGLTTFTIITCQANALIFTIHDRMPLVLDDGAAEDWMNPREQNESRIAQAAAGSRF